MKRVRVRFAPSPTGYLHVGGARTAIFNWLFARHHGGVFILRIEDTDVERSSEPMVQAILQAMEWLGLEPDEGPYYQSRLRERHVADARSLLTSGHAYRCFCSPEVLRQEREAAEKAGGTYTYPRRCLRLAREVSEQRAAAGEPHAVRFLVPQGRIEWHDLVHGPTAFESDVVEDFVLLRSDGSPTYMLSVVSDDIATEITHVIRGDDHLSNTPKQILLYGALGHAPPEFAHLPMILGEDKKRLSKRHGATSVLEYREQGYLPDALLNFLALLGWSPGDDREKMSRDEMIEAFDFTGVGKSPAVFGVKKLEWLNAQYLASLSPETLLALVRPWLLAAGLWDEAYAAERKGWLLALLALLQPRCRTLAEFAEAGRPLLDPSDEFLYEEAAASKHLKGDDLIEHLRAFRERLARTEAWTKGPLEEALRAIAEHRSVPASRLIHATRLAVTGRGAGPGLFEVLELAGKERTLARLDRLVGYLSALGR